MLLNTSCGRLRCSTGHEGAGGSSPGQQAALKAHILRGPEPERDGVSAWRLADLCEHVERAYGVRYSQWGLSCLLKRLNLSRQKTRPLHPKGNPAAQAPFKKGAALKAANHRGGAP